jgi:hypothetical protein
MERALGGRVTPGSRGSRRTVEALRERLARESSRNRWGEAAAVAVLLGFEPIAGQARLTVHADADGIDWEAVLADETWSPSERFLIGTAAGLWSGRRTMIDISRVPFLDDAFLQTWQDMITAALTGHVPGDAAGAGLRPAT